MAATFEAELPVLRVVPVTHDVSTFLLRPPAGWPGHDAGQHLVVQQDIEGHAVERCYTISSPPTRSASLAITVKRQPGGVLSPWLHDHVRPGDRLRVRGAFGSFTLREHPAPSYLFLTAGSGITPVMAMTRALADSGSDVDVVFVHSARSPGDVIFRRELAALPETGLSVRVAVVCEDDGPGDRWDGAKGRLSRELLQWLVPDAAGREVLLCGPPAYMDATSDLLEGLGVDPARVHRESFSVGNAAELFDEVASAAPGAARIELRASGRTVTCPPGSTVLDAITEAGVLLRSSCRQGLCGTCKLALVAGEVDMRHQGGIRQREIDRGGFLPCCSRPRGDLVVEA